MRGEVSSGVAAGAAGGPGIVPCRAGCHAGGRRYIAPGVSGEVAEWLKALAWKACIRETVSWVRIPLPPPTPFAIRSPAPKANPAKPRCVADGAVNLWTLPRSGKRGNLLHRPFFSRALYFEAELRSSRTVDLRSFLRDTPPTEFEVTLARPSAPERLNIFGSNPATPASQSALCGMSRSSDPLPDISCYRLAGSPGARR